ncbi:MAG: phenylalanine--tRNA ligase subunit beta [Bacteroidales bacterium]|nr:phenylalanine--tRNA ligase subunit beta [Bacteroidales bacterium]MCF8390145.1 phenylalanine--tRNA ligase subunit beta [Bacteroidales bacterium]
MKISYNWLKDYIDYLPEPEECAKILTDIGLEVEGFEKFESVKGGLEGVVVGQVLSCKPHPNADNLSVTTVNTGTEVLPIVCGAPNVATGQKVAVAVVGTTLYMGDEELKLKKVKIRGEVSEGMICAEDELGIGTDHEGILVLDPKTEIGTPASEYFKIEKDVVFEIGLTPNRIDGASHYGVARDLAAFLKQHREVNLAIPDVNTFKPDNNKNPYQVIIENKEACIRYSGITISNVAIKESPEWLQNKLKAIGLKPINNVVDITNFVLHETGQPLHGFDADKIAGKKVIIKTLAEGTKFVSLDEKERILSSEDLMICSEKEGMCIAGVFGGIDSGVKNSTKNIFLESACFHPVYVRKTSKRHLLNTDSSFRFERGSDPNITVYALKRAAMLIKELAGGEISSEIVDVYPDPVADFDVNLSYEYLNTLIGKEIEREKVKSILENLDIKVVSETKEGLELKVPPYRVDVQRPADVVEEVLRIYGYNNISFPDGVRSNLSYSQKPDIEKVNHLSAELLSNIGFNEIMSNSLTKSSYYETAESKDESLVRILNPLSNDLNCMRKTLLFGGLEAVSYNINRKNSSLRFFEFGNTYSINTKVQSNDPHKKYFEEKHLALFQTGSNLSGNWKTKETDSDFFQLKSYVELLLKRFNLQAVDLVQNETDNAELSQGLKYSKNNKLLVEFGKVKDDLVRKFEIEQEVFYADFHWNNILRILGTHKTQFVPLTKFPEVRRDLSMILDQSVKFEDLRQSALKSERKLLRKVDIFDVYDGDKIEKGKKSYALSFILQDEYNTLTDKQIDKAMKNIANSLERELGAQIRV